MKNQISLISIIAILFASPAIAQFAAMHPGASTFKDHDGRITRLYGKAFSHGNSPTDSAQTFLDDWAPIWNCDANDLIPVGPWGSGNHQQPMMYNPDTGLYKFTGVGYMQTVNGVPVYGSRLTVLVRNEPNFPAVHITADIHDVSELIENPVTMNTNGILKAIQKHLAGVHTIAKPTLCVFAGTNGFTTTPTYAYVTEAIAGYKSNQTYEKWLYFVNASTSDIIYRENRILDVIDGNVSGNATQSSGADECDEELVEPMPYVLVTGGGDSTFADANGDYSLNVDGDVPVIVTSAIQGQWFNVNHQQGSDTVLESNVPPGEQGDFLHNSANLDEFNRAEVNAYVESNVVRDYVLAINPSYPTIGTQTNWPVNVNMNDSCNAYYDYSSINFYNNAGGCNNTAFSVIVHHEYGHHLVAVAGSGQGAYGEGMGDVMGVLITGDAELARGFYTGNCSSGIRNADNNCQYSETNCSSCGSEIHSCGQLISGCIWDMLEYFQFEPAGFDLVSNLAVNSIMLHNGSGINSAIAIDFLTLDDDDSDIGNGTPNYQAIEYAFELHGIDVPQLNYLMIDLTAELPNSFNPNGGDVIALSISDDVSQYQPGSAEIFFGDGNGGLVIYPLNDEGDGTHTFVVPPVDCGNLTTFWFIARTTDDVIVFFPSGAPDERFNVVSASELNVAIDDNFEEDLGWVVTGDSPTGWQRGIPQQEGGDWIPHADYDGSGQCYVTGNNGAGGGNDLELTTILTSPVMDTTSGGTLSWAYWLSERPNNPHGPEDDFQLLASNDGENWSVIRDYDSYLSNGGWRTESVVIEVGGEIEPSPTLQIRFLATDIAPDNRIEAGIDAVEIIGIICDEVSCPADANGDENVNVNDLLIVIGNWGQSDSPADVNNDGIVNVSDILVIIDAWGPCS